MTHSTDIQDSNNGTTLANMAKEKLSQNTLYEIDQATNKFNSTDGDSRIQEELKDTLTRRELILESAEEENKLNFGQESLCTTLDLASAATYASEIPGIGMVTSYLTPEYCKDASFTPVSSIENGIKEGFNYIGETNDTDKQNEDTQASANQPPEEEEEINTVSGNTDYFKDFTEEEELKEKEETKKEELSNAPHMAASQNIATPSALSM